MRGGGSAGKLSSCFQINPGNIVIISSFTQFFFLVEKAKITPQIHREILVVRLRPDKLPWLIWLSYKDFYRGPPILNSRKAEHMENYKKNKKYEPHEKHKWRVRFWRILKTFKSYSGCIWAVFRRPVSKSITKCAWAFSSDMLVKSSLSPGSQHHCLCSLTSCGVFSTEDKSTSLSLH